MPPKKYHHVLGLKFFPVKAFLLISMWTWSSNIPDLFLIEFQKVFLLNQETVFAGSVAACGQMNFWIQSLFPCDALLKYDGQEHCVFHTSHALIAYEVLFEFMDLFTRNRWLTFCPWETATRDQMTFDSKRPFHMHILSLLGMDFWSCCVPQSILKKGFNVVSVGHLQ